MYTSLASYVNTQDFVLLCYILALLTDRSIGANWRTHNRIPKLANEF